MIEFLTTEAFPFSVAIALMLLFGLLELAGLGLSGLDVDFEYDVDHEVPDHANILGWLGIGRVPLSVVMVVFLATFGVSGLIVQSFLHLPIILASIIALAVTLPSTGFLSGLLAAVWPQDETTIVNLDHLLGKRAELFMEAGPGRPAEAKVYDIYNQPHYIFVEPHGNYTIPAGAKVLLVSRVEGTSTFRGVDPTGGFRPISIEEGTTA